MSYFIVAYLMLMIRELIFKWRSFNIWCIKLKTKTWNDFFGIYSIRKIIWWTSIRNFKVFNVSNVVLQQIIPASQGCQAENWKSMEIARSEYWLGRHGAVFSEWIIYLQKPDAKSVRREIKINAAEEQMGLYRLFTFETSRNPCYSIRPDPKTDIPLHR